MNDATPINVSDEPFDVTPTQPEENQPAAPRSKVRFFVLGSLLVVLLLVAAAVGTAGWRILQQKDTDLATPDQVAGLSRDQGEQAADTGEYLRNALAAEVDLDDTVGAVYSDRTADGPAVLLFGGTTLLWTPESDLDKAFALLSDDTGSVTGLRAVPAGPLGGVMKCGNTSSPDGPMAVCGWADHGSLALAMFPDRDADQAAPLMLSIRQGVQIRR